MPCPPPEDTPWVRPIGHWRFCYRRQRAAQHAPTGALRACLESPLPSARQAVADCRFLAVDLETTGLDPEHDAILSIGWVAMDGVRIDLSTADQRLVRADCPVPEQSAVIHRITDREAAGGTTVDSALDALFEVLQGRVLVAHHAALELGFLEEACYRLYGVRPPLPVVDTLRLAERQLRRAGRPIPADGMRLHTLRGRYNLPQYRAHDALFDALAAGELFVALVSQLSPEAQVPLERVLFRPGWLW
ncbi:Exonuclease RNase T and DNA polymerase III [Thioalkalivibrio sp. K90mix]|uniref:exonuclease domain-containing protein n=1 Tax=Thioalkalivibrio sp. (strain K90mix) TaxID=396595 RepID=UPI0001959201|nr:exonuclease domain-containing protein [Thioalkalivibrio sp. K90mix]ADC72358.1 Exonuclease RNase T and DNA polymerase III [Thioalkalivibrio sp. K90mix]